MKNAEDQNACNYVPVHFALPLPLAKKVEKWASKHGYTTSQAVAFIFNQMCIYNDITQGKSDDCDQSYFGNSFASFLDE